MYILTITHHFRMPRRLEIKDKEVVVIKSGKVEHYVASEGLQKVI